MSKKRIVWIDLAKAFGIIAVVIGHALPVHGTLFRFLYWWNVPIFFISSGFFLKPVVDNHWWAFLKRKIWPLLLSYFGAGTFLILLSHFVKHQTWHYTAMFFVHLVYGGRTLNHYLSIFWFINVFILALIATTIIITYVKSRDTQIIIGFLSLLLGVSYKKIHFFMFKYTPWDFDVTLIAVFFMLFGYLFFPQIKEWVTKTWVTVSFGIFVLFLIWEEHLKIFNFGFYLKSHQIHAKPLSPSLYSAVIPIIVVLVVFGVSYWLSFAPGWLSKPFDALGQHTMFVMYMHKAVLDISARMGIHSLIIQIILAIIVPLLISLVYVKWFKPIIHKPIKAAI